MMILSKARWWQAIEVFVLLLLREAHSNQHLSTRIDQCGIDDCSFEEYWNSQNYWGGGNHDGSNKYSRI
jgi:hypothetical protein